MSLAVLVRQMPGSAKDVIFITLEDETLIANLIVWRSVFDANRVLEIARPNSALNEEHKPVLAGHAGD